MHRNNFKQTEPTLPHVGSRGVTCEKRKLLMAGVVFGFIITIINVSASKLNRK